MDVEYTYYTGFELEFKSLTKRVGKKSYYEEKYKNEIEEFNKDSGYKSDSDLSQDSESDYYSSEEEDDEEDEFNNMNVEKKKIKQKKIEDLKESYLFYYLINKRAGDQDKKSYDCNIIIFDKDIKDWLCDIENLDLDLYNLNGTKIYNCVDLDHIYTFINDFRINLSKNKYKNPKFKLFISYIEDIFRKDIARMDKMIESKMIDFESLWYYLDKIGTNYVVEIFEKNVCFNYNSFSYGQYDVTKLCLDGTIMLCNQDGNTYYGTYKFYINSFIGKRPLDSFKIRVIKDEEIELFKQSSSIVKDKIKNIKQMKLEGKQFIDIDEDNFIGIERNERVILDNHQNKIEKLLPKNILKYGASENKDIIEDILVFPFLPVFNLGSGKIWGLAHYDDLKEVKYKKDVFDSVVMEESKKNIIKKLTENYDYNISNNLIDSKGRNLTFLFHGPPGVGKTLTAIAISELMERPLYQVNISDLELDPTKLELNLKEISKCCKRWNAVLLIDEADIFLEARNFSDIMRNTIVAIFLNFLEHNSSIMFLTTNRLETLDAAVKSRINLIVTYFKLKEKDRYCIWNNLLKDIKIKSEEKKSLLLDLSKIELNGREVGNMLNIVSTMLKDECSDGGYTKDQFMKVLKTCMAINNESDFNVKQSSLYL